MRKDYQSLEHPCVGIKIEITPKSRDQKAMADRLGTHLECERTV